MKLESSIGRTKIPVRSMYSKAFMRAQIDLDEK